MSATTREENRGLYRSTFEHDSCGIGFIANINGVKTNQVLSDAITMLENMEHRGGKGSSPKTGDGAGVLMQLPHDFFMEESSRLGFTLPALGKYGVGMVFFPRNKKGDERLS
jgi:glutamate synthase (NADPH/NADH) large chain